MKLESGFRAYLVFCCVKAHFTSKNYNILKGLANKERFTKKWNSDRYGTDGKLYFILDEHFLKIKEVIYLYAVYLWYNNKIHISNIINDNYELWKRHREELKNFKTQLTIDKKKIKLYIDKECITFKELLNSPIIFNLNISLFTLIYLNMKYNITESVKTDSELEEERLTKKRLQLDKLTLIFEKEISKR